jgi:hypothetical protein
MKGALFLPTHSVRMPPLMVEATTSLVFMRRAPSPPFVMGDPSWGVSHILTVPSHTSRSPKVKDDLYHASLSGQDPGAWLTSNG